MGATSAIKKWTVMVYLAGDNNLDGSGVVDLGEMKSVGSTDEVNIVAQFDRQGRNGESRRFYLRKGGDLDADAVMSLGETNTGDPKVLEDFITWGITDYPAERCMVVLWNHGSGWDDTNIYRMIRDDLNMDVSRKAGIIGKTAGESRGIVSSRTIRQVSNRTFKRALFDTSVRMALTAKAIAFDDQAKDFLDNREMKKVLTGVRKKLKRKIDVLGMDACLMNMVEVAYQVRGSVAFTVGSEETEPGDGWPYDKIVAELVKNPDMPARELTKVIVRKYLASYGAGDGVTQSALDLSRADSVGTACDRMAETLLENLKDDSVRNALLTARSRVQSYEVSDYVDLADLAELILNETPKAPIANACADVIQAVTHGFVIKSGHKGQKMAHSHGVSIYFPWRGISPLYTKLDFSRDTAWNELLKRFQSGTERPTKKGGQRGL